MEEMQLRVEDASSSDVGRGVLHLDSTTLRKLQLSRNDIVEVRGTKKTTARVTSNFLAGLFMLFLENSKDARQDMIASSNPIFGRIDKFTQYNAGVSIGEKITIKKVEALEAKKLTLALPESMTQGGPILQFGEHANEIVKRHILKRPVFVGDIIPIINSMPQPKTKSLTTCQVIPLVAVETDPSNTIVQISEETTIELLHKTVQFPESHEEEKEAVSKLAIDDANQILEPHDLVITKNEIAGEMNLCETKDTSVSATKNVQKEITFAPSVFEIPKKSNVLSCVSVMMPFSTEFDDVLDVLNDACYEVGMSCHKADDFWHHSAIIQDIFELIFRSSIVIVDFTGKNPNVFYEAGIAHTLGKTVLPITQNGDDIPFDLRHHRYVLYHNDREGLKKLKRELVSKLNFEKGRE